MKQYFRSVIITTVSILFITSSKKMEAQVNINSYVFSTESNAIFYSETGAINIIGPNSDAETSDNILLPFPFAFAGAVHNYVNASSSGRIFFSGTNFTNTYALYPFYVQGTVSSQLNASAMGTSATGAVRFSVTGSAPFRKVVIGFHNMSINKASGANNASFQTILHESTGVIEFIYGKMETAVPLGLSNNSFRPGIGQTNLNRYQFVNTGNHTASQTSTVSTNNFATGVITDLNATSPSQCRLYRFTPPQVQNFTNTQMNFSGTSSGGTLLNFNHQQDGSINFLLFDSIPAVIGYNATTLLGSASFAQHNRGYAYPGVRYYLRVYASNGGSISTNFAEGSYQPLPPLIFTSQKNGNWNDNTVWGTAAGVLPGLGDSVVIRSVDTVAVNSVSQCGALHINGVVDFALSGIQLLVTRNLSFGTGGVLNANDKRFRGASVNQTVGKPVQVLGSILGNGIMDFSYNGSLLRIEEGAGLFSEHRIETPFTQVNGRPLLRNLLIATTKPIQMLTPVTIVERIDAEKGTIVTNNNITLDHRRSPTPFFPSAISIFRFSREPLFNGTVIHGTGVDYNINLNYLRNRTKLVPNDDAFPAAFTAGTEVPANGIVNRMLLGSQIAVVFNQPVTLKDELNLQGNLYLGTNNLTLVNSSTIFYNNGGITTTGQIISETSEQFFPIKYNGMNRFIRTNLSAGSFGTVSVRFVHADGNTDFSAPYTEAGLTFTTRSNFYWQIVNNYGSGNAGLQNSSLELRATNFPQIADYTKFGISRINGPAVGTHQTATLGNSEFQCNRNDFTYPDISGDFYLAFDKATALPVTLLQFTATKENTTAQLQWQTSSEQNNRGFAVQRSSNGNNFEQIGFVAAKGNGNSTNEQSYSFNDAQPLNGVNYYRLKQVDIDGSFYYSETRTLVFEKGNSFKVYPMVTENNVRVELGTGQALQGTTNLRLIDVNGKLHMNARMLQSQQNISLQHLPAGVYILQIQQEKTLYQQKIIKQ